MYRLRITWRNAINPVNLSDQIKLVDHKFLSKPK
jgi:hypothetical protein